MDRVDLLNSLIHRRGFRRYLEVGVGNPGGAFRRVECARKTGVDPAPLPGDAGPGAEVFREPSDTFFARGGGPYDLVFIDGLHEEEQAARDLSNALSRLSSGGVVVLHDCLPPDEWHQRPALNFAPGEPWTGDVWKVALRQLAEGPWDGRVVDSDWGCAVIDTAARRRSPRERLPDRLSYATDFTRLFPYVRTEAEFLTDLYGVEVFYHAAGLGDWRSIVGEHFGLLGNVGLTRVTVSHVGPGSDLPYVFEAGLEAGIDVAVAAHSERLTDYEAPALRLVERWARAHPDGSALYLHTKGASAPGCPHKRQWRELMNREVVGRWAENVRALDHNDLVGVNWMDWPQVAHFSGNFWWARGDWLQSLAPFDEYYRNPRFATSHPAELRLGCEFWISSATARPRVLSLACANTNFLDASAFDALV